MSVLIKGMEMPTRNDELRLIIRSNGQVIISHKTHYEEAEAVPVPPHGRLGDLNELERRIKEEGANQAEQYGDRRHPVVMAYGDCFGKVKSAPTIIPASEEGE